MPSLTIKESFSDLEMRLEKEKIPNRRVRLEALILKKKHANYSNIEIADALKLNRSTVGRWFNIYKNNGLRQYLNVERSASKARKLLSLDQQTVLVNAINCGDVKTYRQAQKWLSEEYGLILDYKNVHAFILYQMKINLTDDQFGFGSVTIPRTMSAFKG